MTQLEDAITRGTWDRHVPDDTGAGLTSRGIVASVRDAANVERDRVHAAASRATTPAPYGATSTRG